MFLYVFDIFITVGKLFGKIPWIYAEEHKLSHLFSKIYSGFIVIVFFVYYFYRLQYNDHNMSFNITKQVIYFNFISSTVLGAYLSHNDWKKFFVLFEDFRTSFKTELNRSKKLGLKLIALILFYSLYFVIFQVLKHHYGFNNNIADSFLYYTVLFSNIIPIIILITLQEGFKRINRYWTNISKWHKIGLKIRRGRDTEFCKKQYEIIYNMYLCYQKATTWIIAIFLTDHVVYLVLFLNQVIQEWTTEELSLWYFILMWGTKMETIVSIVRFYRTYY